MRFRLICVALVAAGMAPAQEQARQLWNTDLKNARMEAPKAAPKPGRGPIGVGAAPKAAPAAAQSSEILAGFTLLACHPAKPAETQSRAFVIVRPPGGKPVPEVCDRMDPRIELAPDAHYRMSVEVASLGYLYMVDREMYKDGSFGKPSLIYPAEETAAADNVTAPGRLIYVPGAAETIVPFTLESTRADHVGEEISLVISPEPLTGIKAGEPLPESLYASWVKQWRVQAKALSDGSAGKAESTSENRAGAGRGATLGKDDPLPETLLRAPRQPGATVLIAVTLKVRK